MINAEYVKILKNELIELQEEYNTLRALIGPIAASDTTLAKDIKDLEGQIAAAENGEYED